MMRREENGAVGFKEQDDNPGDDRGSALQRVLEILHAFEKRLGRIETSLSTLTDQRQIQDWYDTATAAEILEKSAYSVREWCRLGRVRAEKRSCGRGTSKEWMISHVELTRIKSEGLLPQRLPR